jgi:hypothetical protein
MTPALCACGQLGQYLTLTLQGVSKKKTNKKKPLCNKFVRIANKWNKQKMYVVKVTVNIYIVKINK